MKKILASILIIAALFGAGVAITAELQPITFMFTGRWQPSEDPVLLDDNGLQDIQNLRKVGKHFKGISGHTAINATSVSAAPYFLNGFHFRKDQPQESHVLVTAAPSDTLIGTYLYENITSVPSAGSFSATVLNTRTMTSLVKPDASVFTSGTYAWIAHEASTLENVSNALIITPVNSQYGGYTYLSDSFDLVSDLVIGKRYRIIIDAKYTGGNAGPFIEIVSPARGTVGVLTTAMTTFAYDFTADSQSRHLLRCAGLSAGNVVTIDNFNLYEIQDITPRFSVAPQGNMVYANGSETLIWGGNEIAATSVIASSNSLSGSSSAITSPQDFTDQLRNTLQTADQVAVIGNTDTYTKLLLHLDGADASTVFTNAVSTDMVFTASASAQLDTAQRKYGTASLLLAAATSDYVYTSDSSDWEFGSGNFTIDAWVRFNSSPAGTFTDLVSTMTGASAPAPFVASGSTPYAGTYPWMAFDDNVNTVMADDGTDGIMNLIIDLGSTKTVTRYRIRNTLGWANPKTFVLSASTDAVTYTTLDTRASETGWALYGEYREYEFTNTTAYRYYKLNVTAAETVFTVAVGEMNLAEAVTDAKTFPIISHWGAAGNKSWSLNAGPNTLYMSYTTNGTATTTKSVAWTPSTGTWYHVAAVRNGNDLKFYVNGKQQGATQDVTGITIYDSTASLIVGADSTTNYYDGWIDELRISKGIARWTSDFTPQTTAYLGTTGNPYVFVGFTRPLQGVKFYISNPNNIASTMTVQEWNGVSWTPLTITDGTSAGGISLAQTGSVTWTSTVNTSAVKYIAGLPIYWYQFYLSAGNATIYYVTVDAPMQSITNIWDGRLSFAAAALKWNGTSYIDYTNAVNDDTSLTYMDLSSLANTHYVLLGFTEPMQGIEATMVAGQENATATTAMTLSYWNGSAWTAAAGLSDGTATTTTSLNKSGTATYQLRTAGLEYPQTVTGEVPLYYYKLQFANTLDSTTQIAEIRGISAPKSIGTYAFAQEFQNRLFLFSEYAGQKNKAIYSNDNAPDIFNGSDSGTLYFGDNTEIIAAAYVYNILGNTATDQLIVGKKSEIYRLAGDGPTTWTVKRISPNVGVVAPLSMVSCEISGNTQVVIWQGDKGFYMTDGSSVIPISDDIRAYFDPNDSRYIPTTRRSKTVAWYDPSLRVYKALISSGSGQTYHNVELEYSLMTKEWTKIHRDSAAGDNPLQCGFQVWDTNGIGYTYGGDKTGFLYRLENGNTFAGTAIIQFLQTKDMILDTTAPFFRKSSAKYLRTAHKKKTAASGGGTITVSHYGDQILSVDGTSNQIVPDAWSMATSPYNTQSIALGPALYHSFKFTTSDTTATDGMELIGLGIYAEPYTAMR